MADITVEKLAKIVGIPPSQLLLRLQEAGVKVDDKSQKITDEQKNLLLGHLKSSHSSTAEAAPKLKLKKPTSGAGASPSRSNVISVTVRKRRTQYDVDKELVAHEEKLKRVFKVLCKLQPKHYTYEELFQL